VLESAYVTIAVVLKLIEQYKIDEQIQLEVRVLDIGKVDEGVNRLIALADSPRNGEQSMSAFIADWLGGNRSRKHKAAPFIKHLAPADVVRTVAEEVMLDLASRTQGKAGGNYRECCKSIGRRCIELTAQRLLAEADNSSFTPRAALRYAAGKTRQYSREQGYIEEDTIVIEHDERDLYAIGTPLLMHLVLTTGIMDSILPDGSGDTKRLHLTSMGYDLISGLDLGSVLPTRIPMLHPPYPHGDEPAGYYSSDDLPVDLVELREKGEFSDKVQASEGYARIQRSVNHMQSIGWRLNQRVADVYLALKHDGGDVAGIAAPYTGDSHVNDKLSSAAKAVLIDKIAAERTKAMSEDLRERLVNLYSGKEAFYYPHWCDWRGRCYPDCVVKLFSHQGDKVARGLLEFAEGVAITSYEDMEGVFIQAALCLGDDKLAKSEKVAKYHEKIDELAEYARAPLVNRGWIEADKPWQLLQCCFIFADFVDAGRTFPFSCHLPCETDGSNNGYQHYAALTLSRAVGETVNITSTGIRHDLYVDVMEATKRLLGDDAIGSYWKEHLSRDLIKDPTMIVVYGSGASGRQHSLRAKILKLASTNNDTQLELGAADEHLSYLSKRVEKALEGAAPDAMAAMNWLKGLAQARVKYYGGDMQGCFEWVSAIGLPIRIYKGHTEGAALRISLLDPSLKEGSSPKWVQMVYEEPHVSDADEQATGAPANYIQSQDASHMHATSLKMAAEGLAFVAVHDAYITHSTHLGRLNELLREAFVCLYQDTNHLMALYESQPDGMKAGLAIEESYLKSEPYTPPSAPPIAGTLAIAEVQQNPYFFS
jgi:DNA-directed RNA polymerase